MPEYELARQFQSFVVGSMAVSPSEYYFINRTVWNARVIHDPTRRSRLYFSNSRTLRRSSAIWKPYPIGSEA